MKRPNCPLSSSSWLLLIQPEAEAEPWAEASALQHAARRGGGPGPQGAAVAGPNSQLRGGGGSRPRCSVAGGAAPGHGTWRIQRQSLAAAALAARGERAATKHRPLGVGPRRTGRLQTWGGSGARSSAAHRCSTTHTTPGDRHAALLVFFFSAHPH